MVFSISRISETDMDSSDHEARLKALHGQCREKEKIVAKLRRTLKKHAGSKKQELKAQEAAVQKQIEALDVMIAKAKEQLEFIENNKVRFRCIRYKFSIHFQGNYREADN